MLAIMNSLCAYIFYKIFVNSINVITNIGSKSAYTIEEVMGASLAIAIAISCIGSINTINFDEDMVIEAMKKVKIPDWIQVEIDKLNDENIPI